MAKLALVRGSTSVTVYLFIQNSSVTTGAGLTGLVFNSASLVAYYVRPLGAATAITLATQTVTGAFSSGGFVEVDATNMPGIYRFDLPDAVCATGVSHAVVMLKGATNMVPIPLEIQLTNFDLNDADPDVNVVKWLGTTAATPTVAGVPEVDVTHWIGTAAATPTVAGVPEVDITHVLGTASAGAAGSVSVSALTAAAKAEVKAEALAVLNTDTFAEPAQGAPAATATLAAKIGHLYKAYRNRKTQTSTTWSLYNDDAVTVDHKSTVSDNGTTAERGEVATGP